MSASESRKAASRYRIDKQRAETIINADTVDIGTPRISPAERAQELLRLGEKALGQRMYSAAATSLEEGISLGELEPSAFAQARFLLAVALLGGRRPSLCTGSELDRVCDLLRTLSEPRAVFLATLVEEDRTNAWMSSPAVPDSLRLNAQQVDRPSADLIRRHVPAPQSRVWRVLDERAGEPT